jgi:hypothetical protein
MRQVANHSQNPIQKAFFTAFFSPHAKYTQGWNIFEWRCLAKEIIQRLDLQQNQYICYLHKSTQTPHIHIYANRIDLNGRNHIEAHNIAQQVQLIAAEISKNRQWKTAVENSLQQKEEIKALLVEYMATAKNRDVLNDMMATKGWLLQWNERDEQVIGLRIIPKALYEKNETNPSKVLKNKKLGYKLSEVDRELKVANICQQLDRNALKEQKAIESNESTNISTLSVTHMENSIEDFFTSSLPLQPTEDDDELLSKKKQKKQKKVNGVFINIKFQHNGTE